MDKCVFVAHVIRRVGSLASTDANPKCICDDRPYQLSCQLDDEMVYDKDYGCRLRTHRRCRPKEARPFVRIVFVSQ